MYSSTSGRWLQFIGFEYLKRSLLGHNKRLQTVHFLLVTISAFRKQRRLNFSCSSYLESVGVHISFSCYPFSRSFNSPSQNDINHSEVKGVMSMSDEIRRAATRRENHPERNVVAFIIIDSRTNCLQNIGAPRKYIYRWKN